MISFGAVCCFDNNDTTLFVCGQPTYPIFIGKIYLSGVLWDVVGKVYNYYILYRVVQYCNCTTIILEHFTNVNWKNQISFITTFVTAS